MCHTAYIAVWHNIKENWSYNNNSKPNYVFNLLKFAFEHGYDRQRPH